MEQYRNAWSKNETSLFDLPALQVGEMLNPLRSEDDLLAEMNHGNRD
jgi:hypothetical protein